MGITNRCYSLIDLFTRIRSQAFGMSGSDFVHRIQWCEKAGFFGLGEQLGVKAIPPPFRNVRFHVDNNHLQYTRKCIAPGAKNALLIPFPVLQRHMNGCLYHGEYGHGAT